MIALKNLLNIIRTEAFDHGGIPEVPDHKHGAPQNYSALKRDARGAGVCDPGSYEDQPSDLQYDLELVLESDGSLHWHE